MLIDEKRCAITPVMAGARRTMTACIHRVHLYSSMHGVLQLLLSVCLYASSRKRSQHQGPEHAIDEPVNDGNPEGICVRFILSCYNKKMYLVILFTLLQKDKIKRMNVPSRLP